MAALYKFGAFDPEDGPWEYSNQWATERTLGGGQRLVIAPKKDHVEILMQMLQAMPQPLGLLYVLVVPCGHSKSGRYQSPEPQTKSLVETFLRDFRFFLEEDGRHNLWIASVATSAMLVYDRHNVIYAYGLLDEWRLLLISIGFQEVPSISFPDPHSHHYHASLDAEEHRIISSFDWKSSPLRDSDEQ